MKEAWVKHNVSSKFWDHGFNSTTKTRAGNKWRKKITYIEQNQERKTNCNTRNDATNFSSNPNEKEKRSHLR